MGVLGKKWPQNFGFAWTYIRMFIELFEIHFFIEHHKFGLVDRYLRHQNFQKCGVDFWNFNQLTCRIKPANLFSISQYSPCYRWSNSRQFVEASTINLVYVNVCRKWILPSHDFCELGLQILQVIFSLLRFP